MKNKTLKTLKFGILLFGASFLFINCQKDDDPSPLENVLETNPSMRAEWLGVDELPSKVIQAISSGSQNQKAYNKQSPSFFKLITTDSVVRIIDTLGFKKYSFKSNVSYDIDNFYFENYIVVLDPNDHIKTYTIRYQPDKEWLLENKTENLINFTGKISYYKDDNSLIWQAELINGKANSSMSNTYSSKKDKTNLFKTVQYWHISITYEDCDCHPTHAIGGCTHPITVINVSGGSDPNIPYYSGGGSGENGDPTDPFDGGGGGSTPVNSPTIKEMAIFYIDACMETDGLTGFLNNLDKTDLIHLERFLKENSCTTEAKNFAALALEAWDIDGVDEGTVDFEEQVILDKEFIENDCLYGVYTAMGKAPTFDNYLKNFDSDMSVANLKFGYDVNFSSNYEPEYWDGIAITNSPENYLIKIDFNGDPNLSSSIQGKPKLIIATSFIHEIIHAEMYRKLLSVAQQPDLNFTQWYIQDPYSFVDFKADLKFNFFGVWDFYNRYEWDVPPGQEPSSPQHQQMAANYRNTIISAISEYDNYQNSSSLYEALSWYGLMGTGNYDPTTGLYEKSTVAWELIDEDPNLTAAQERLNIHNTIINFQNNDTNTCN